MRENFLVFGQPIIEQSEIDEVVDSLKNCWLGTGPKVAKFENDFANYKGVKNAVAVNSCTAALHLSILALNLKPGDEIITTAMTFCATVNAIIHAGAIPVLADIEPDTWNIDTKEIEKKITKRTKAIVIVHFAGRACKMDEINLIARKNNLFLLEDCAHAIETRYRGKNAGTFGELAAFSFYSTKNIVTGEGGMVIGKCDEYLSRIKRLALHGMSIDAWKRFSDQGYKHYYVEESGFKYNMMDLQAAIGIHQLKRIDAYHKRRESIWNAYMHELSHLPITLPALPEKDTLHAYHLFNIMINKELCGICRDDFLNEMTKRKIGVGVHYLSIPEHPFYQKEYGWKQENYPNALKFGEETVSLPISAKLCEADVQDVIDAIKDILK